MSLQEGNVTTDALRESFTALYQTPGSTTDAYQTTLDGQLRQISVLDPTRQRTAVYGVSLVGGVLVGAPGDNGTVAFTDADTGAVIGNVTSVEGRTGDGSMVPVVFQFGPDSLTVSLPEGYVGTEQVFVTWSYAPVSVAEQVVLE